MKNILIGTLVCLFVAGMFSNAMAAVMTNSSNDGFEDLLSGDAYSYYQNSGDLVGSVISGNIQNSTDLSTFLVDHGFRSVV